MPTSPPSLPPPMQPPPIPAVPSFVSPGGKTTHCGRGGGLKVPPPARGLSCLHMPALPSPHSLNSPLCTQAPSFWTKARLLPLGTSSQRELHQVTPRLQVSPGLTSHWSGEEAGLGPTETGVIQTCSMAVHTLSISRTQGPNPFQESWASCSSEERQS